MKIVVDTSVFLGACSGTGASNAVVAACLTKRCLSLMGNALVKEYEDVFGRKDLFEKCRFRSPERIELRDVFLSCCEWTRVYYDWRPNLPDESYNHLVEFASGNAFCLMDNHSHFVTYAQRCIVLSPLRT